MAFTQDTFATVGAQSTDTPTIYSYKTDDTSAVVIAAGYFIDKVNQLDAGDVVHAQCFDKYILLGVTADTSTVEEIGGPDIAGGEVMVAESVADQDPTGLDTPLQIEFGAAQITGIIDLAVDGTLTVQQSGVYLVFTTFYFSRTSSTGQVHFFIRLLKDGVQQGNPLGIVQTDDDITTPIFLSDTVELDVVAPTEFTLECVRDGDGVDSGGLRSLTSSIGWGQTPSARMRIIKL